MPVEHEVLVGLGAGDRGADGDHEDVRQRVEGLALVARVVEFGEVSEEGVHGSEVVRRGGSGVAYLGPRGGFSSH